VLGTIRWLGLAFVEFTFEWSADPRRAVQDFVRFCAERAHAAHVLEPIAGARVSLDGAPPDRELAHRR
jgi:hypothetical protein